MSEREPTILGVRHHSPACARLVRHVIRTRRPTHVLIEGPADMNGRMDELTLGHEPPVALFSFLQTEAHTQAVWFPFCAYSPEWVAIQEGLAIGAHVRFIDLPVWYREPVGPDRIENRYSDQGAHTTAYVEALCRKLSVEGMDNLWDHLFEQPLEPAVLRERLSQYFVHLRPAMEASDVLPPHQDDDREAFMARHVAWAMAQSDADVVVICGGWHEPALKRLWRDADPADPPAPTPPRGSRSGTYLVPYGEERLDSFDGYQAGMPSPGWHRRVWASSARVAGEAVLEAATRRLREKQVALSAADLIGATAMTEGLMRLRGHAEPTRADLLDGLAAAVLDDAQSEPFPWNRRSSIGRATDPRLREVLRIMRGDARGELAEGTPAPPLVAAVEARLASHRKGLLGALERAPRKLTLAIAEPEARHVSVFLHRLRVLHVPGFQRKSGPAWPTDGALEETWRVWDDLDRSAALVEASVHGGTLAIATREKLRRRGGDIDALIVTVGDAVLADLPELAELLVRELGERVATEARVGPLGSALDKLLALYRHDVLFGVAGSESVLALMEALVARLVWVLEGMSGATPDDTGTVLAVTALRDACRHAPVADAERVHAVMHRRLGDADCPPVLVGAALGLLWSEGLVDREAGLQAMRAHAEPKRLGVFLQGLFPLARAEVREEPAVVTTLDDLIRRLGEDDFLVALPTLRQAFGVFPARERAQLAEALVGRLGASARGLADRLPVSTESLVAARRLEAEVDAMLAAEGLGVEAAR